jgi:hypothetical protein
MKDFKLQLSGYHDNEMSSVDTLYKSNLGSRSRTSEQSFVSVYHAYTVSNDQILMRICEV